MIDRTIPGRLNGFDRAEIVAAHEAGISVQQLAEEYRRTVATIRHIINSEYKRGQCIGGVNASV
jgi:predicted transcriptional regulator